MPCLLVSQLLPPWLLPSFCLRLLSLPSAFLPYLCADTDRAAEDSKRQTWLIEQTVLGASRSVCFAP
ncbi:hypothetical protein CLOP_g2075 [Closterium sp. NIES-67]|nr:hypothetical protein CLOP_g2075 [Closterium sp. NIES-67]